MADVQLENGYVRIANSILEALARMPLNGTQWRILMVVIRYTYGFHRKECELSESFLSKATGIHCKQVGRELSGLINNNILIVKKPASFSSPRVLAFNKDFETWQGVSTKTLTGNEKATVHELAGLTGIGLVDRTGIESVDQENKIIKINNKDNIYYAIFEHWNSKKIIVHQKLTDEFKKDIDKALKQSSLEEIKKAIDHYAEAYHDPKYEYCKYKWGLHEFLTRKEGYKRFLDDGSKWLNYLRFKNEQQQDKPKSRYREE